MILASNILGGDSMKRGPIATCRDYGFGDGLFTGGR